MFIIKSNPILNFRITASTSTRFQQTTWNQLQSIANNREDEFGDYEWSELGYNKRKRSSNSSSHHPLNFTAIATLSVFPSPSLDNQSLKPSILQTKQNLIPSHWTKTKNPNLVPICYTSVT